MPDIDLSALTPRQQDAADWTDKDPLKMTVPAHGVMLYKLAPVE